jgi:dipeptidyl aminopeptidase/acylaminoacyl peptidase
LIGITAWGVSFFSLVLYPVAFKDTRYDRLAWSPDGATILFRRDNDFYQIDAEGGEPQRFTEQTPADALGYVSPDGTMQVVQDKNDNLWLMNADGSGRRLLVPTGQQNIPFHYEVAWSPDSRWLAFQDTPSDHVDAIKVIQPQREDASAAVLVTADDLEANYLHFFKWSPDSQSLAVVAKYVCCDDTPRQALHHNLFVVSVENPDQPKVFQTRHAWEFIDDFAWSPDGQQIAVSTSFVDTDYDAPHLYTVQVADQSYHPIYGQLNALEKYAKELRISSEDNTLLTLVAPGVFFAPLLVVPLLRWYGRRTRYFKIALVVYYVLLILFCILVLVWLISFGDQLA